MSYRIVHPDEVPQGEGPHPAASPFDRRMSEALGVTAFEVYHVDLPPGAETVDHDHVDDDNDDVYVVLAGDGRLVVDGESVAISAGQFVAVEQHHRRHLVAGPAGLRLVAMCGPREREDPAGTDTGTIRPVERTLVHDSGEDDPLVPGSSVGVDVGGPLAALGSVSPSSWTASGWRSSSARSPGRAPG